MLFQEHSLFPWLSVEDNVAFGLMVKGVPTERRARAREILKTVGLTDFARHFPHQLSGGMTRLRAGRGPGVNTSPSRVITFPDLFEGLGTLELAYRAEAAALDGREVAMAGFVLAAHDPRGRDVLVETPGACPDCTSVPVAAVALDWLGARPDAGAAGTPVVVEGRLGVGLAIDGDGTASFLRLTDARATPLPRARS